MTKNLTPAMVTALRSATFQAREAKRDGHTGYLTHAKIHPSTRAALHRIGLMHGHYYLTAAGVCVLRDLTDGAETVSLPSVAYYVANAIDSDDAPVWEGYAIVPVEGGFHIVRPHGGVPLTLHPITTREQAADALRRTVNGERFGDLKWAQLGEEHNARILADLFGEEEPAPVEPTSVEESELRRAFDNMERTNNGASLVDLIRYAAPLWERVGGLEEAPGELGHVMSAARGERHFDTLEGHARRAVKLWQSIAQGEAEAIDSYEAQEDAPAPAEPVTISYAAYEEPKTWRSDIGQHTAYGDVVVTCAEHGEVIRFLATNPFDTVHPETHTNAQLWKSNHLHTDHPTDRVQSGQSATPKGGTPVSVEFAPDEVTPTGDDLDRGRARAELLAEWDHNGTAWPFVTVGMAWEVKRYALVYDVDLPDLDDKEAVRAFVDAARTA